MRVQCTCLVCHLELENIYILRLLMHIAKLPTRMFVSNYISTNTVMVSIACHPQNTRDRCFFLITSSNLCMGI